LEITSKFLASSRVSVRATLSRSLATANGSCRHRINSVTFARTPRKRRAGPWSVKDGVITLTAPANARVRCATQLRGTSMIPRLKMGPLRAYRDHRWVWPYRGLVTEGTPTDLSTRIAVVDCLAPREELAMRPLMWHASSNHNQRLRGALLHIGRRKLNEQCDGLKLVIE